MNYNRHDEKAPADFSAGACDLVQAISLDTRQVRSSIEGGPYLLAPDLWLDAECGQSLLDLPEVNPRCCHRFEQGDVLRTECLEVGIPDNVHGASVQRTDDRCRLEKA